VAAEIPGAQRVVVPGVGHGTVTADSSGCASSVLLRFLDGDAIATACPRVPTGVPAVVIPPRRFADIPAPAAPGSGSPPAATRLPRTIAGLGLTLDDVRFALSPAFLSLSGGGLRGGTYRASGRAGLVLRRYSAIGGLQVSGRWRNHRLRLRIGGRAAAPGHLSIAPSGRFTGVLAHTRVAGRLPHRPPHPSGTGGVT
jgi:hypothetical protein